MPFTQPPRRFDAVPQRPPSRLIWGEPVGLLCLGLGLFLGWSALFYIFGALLITWEAETGLSKAHLSLGLTVSTLVAALSAPFAGRLIDHDRGPSLLALGALTGALGLAGVALSTGPIGFLAAWAVIGVAQGTCLFEPSFAFLARAMQHRAGRGITLVGLIAGLATVPAYWGVGLLVELHGWRWAVAICAAVTACATAPLMYLGALLLDLSSRSSAAAPRAPAAREGLNRARRRPVFWALLFAFAALAVTEGLLLGHAVAAMVEFGQSERTALAVMATMGPCMTAARLGLFSLRKLRSILTLTIAAAAVMVAGTALLPWSGTGLYALVAIAAFGIGNGLIVVLKPMLVAECLGFEAIGAVLAALAQPCFVALALAPLAGALLWQHGGYALAITVAAAVGSVGIATLIALAAFSRR